MRLFLFGSYTTGTATKKSDIDVFITDNSLSGYDSANRDRDSKERAILIDNLEPLSLEYNGRLDLFMDNKDEFHSAYNPDRKLFGQTFLFNLEHEIQKTAREITPEELEELLMLSTFEERLNMVNKILEREMFLS